MRSTPALTNHAEKGAQLALTDIHPHGEAGQSNTSDFGQVAAAIDEAERIAGERIGGATDVETAAIQRVERRLYRLRPTAASDWTWLARRLARASENGWHGGEVEPLIRLAM